MISENSLKRISHIFCGDTEDLYAYKKGPSLLLFIIIIIIQVKNMDLDFRQDGCMFMINWFNWSNQTD